MTGEFAGNLGRDDVGRCDEGKHQPTSLKSRGSCYDDAQHGCSSSATVTDQIGMGYPQLLLDLPQLIEDFRGCVSLRIVRAY